MASTAAWLGRVAFGVFFVTSVIAVWTAILVIAMSGDKDDSRSSRGSRSSAVWFNVLDIVRLFSYMNVYRSYDDDIEERRDPNRMNFLESVFSFMFGDGDPNAEFDDLRWNTIGNYIRSHGGVVVAEELAPFLDLPEKTDEESFVVDEGFMLPVLTRFEGEPIVNEQGQLVYVFPKFQTTAMSWMPRKQPPSTVSHLAEQRWQFSKAKWGQLALVASFAVANVIGVSILDGLVYEQFAAGAISIPLGLPYLLMALQVYAWSFFAIPLFRWLTNRWRNRTIDTRNQRRARSAKSLTLPSASLREKLESAQRLKKRQFVSRKDVVYSSSREMEEQSKKWEEEDFERRLNEIGQ